MPQGPLLYVAPSLLAKSSAYGSVRIDPVEVGKLVMNLLGPNEQSEIQNGLNTLKMMSGVDLKDDIGKSLGPAATMLFTLDDWMGETFPAEVIFAYEVQDTEKLKNSVSKLLLSLQPFTGAMFPLQSKKLGDADTYVLNMGSFELALAIKPGVFFITFGAGPSTIEKAVELIDRGGNNTEEVSGEPKIAVQFDVIRSSLEETRSSLLAQGFPTEDIDAQIESMKLFDRLVTTFYVEQDILWLKATLSLSTSK
jgi:hypothetical protein